MYINGCNHIICYAFLEFRCSRSYVECSKILRHRNLLHYILYRRLTSGCHIVGLSAKLWFCGRRRIDYREYR